MKIVHPMPKVRFTDCLRRLVGVPAWLLIGLVRIYQLSLSPIIGRHCRFEPSCSVYFIESVRKYGAVRGGAYGIWRIMRCNPWNPGGYDPP
jgi:putative membrane protein insertion efficiency factor